MHCYGLEYHVLQGQARRLDRTLSMNEMKAGSSLQAILRVTGVNRDNKYTVTGERSNLIAQNVGGRNNLAPIEVFANDLEYQLYAYA